MIKNVRLMRWSYDHYTNKNASLLYLCFECIKHNWFYTLALIRSLVKETNFPFTVFIFILGCALGVLSVLVEEVSKYTLLAGIDPHLMLHIFLPVLIFESAYALDTHTFVKSFAQVVVLAVPCFCE